MRCARNKKLKMKVLLQNRSEFGMPSPTRKACRSGKSKIRTNFPGSAIGQEMRNLARIDLKKFDLRHLLNIRVEQGRIPGSRSFLQEMWQLAPLESPSCKVFANYPNSSHWSIWFTQLYINVCSKLLFIYNYSIFSPRLRLSQVTSLPGLLGKAVTFSYQPPSTNLAHSTNPYLLLRPHWGTTPLLKMVR